MIPAIVGLLVTAFLVYSVWEIVSGLIDIFVGFFLMITGALLYCLSFPAELIARLVRLIWR